MFAFLFLASCSNTEDTFQLTGVAEAPKQIIYSQAEGQIEEILQAEGETVESNDAVGRIDDEFYTYETEEAEAATKAIESEIDRLEDQGVNEDDIEVLRFELDQAEAKLNQAEYRQSKTDIVTPNEGIITEWFIREGDVVQIGTPLLSLHLEEPMELTIYVPQNRLSEFAVGETISITAIALPDETFEGEIVQIAEEAVYSPESMETTEDKAKKVFPVDIEIEDYGNLKSGMDVTVE